MAAPAPALSHEAIIQASWSRCRAFGLNHQSVPAFDQLPAEGIAQLLESQHSLVQTTHQAPRNQIVLIDPRQPQPANWKTIVPQSADVITSAWAGALHPTA